MCPISNEQGFGLAVMAVAWLIDLTWRERRFGFWLHLAGAAAFWGSLTMHEGAHEWQAFPYCLINIALVFLSVYLGRRIYAIFGAIGIAIYLRHLASTIFEDSLLFSFALSAIGLLTIGLGIAFHKKQEAMAMSTSKTRQRDKARAGSRFAGDKGLGGYEMAPCRGPV